MTTVKDVLQYIDSLAPGYMKEDWDNVGLLCGSLAQPVSKILVALDPFPHVCREAAETGADLLITHHPLIFQGVKSITDETAVGKAILTLASHGISAINAHTNLDCAPGGVNDVLAQALGLAYTEVIQPSGTDEEGRPWGLLRKGIVAPMALEQFLGNVKASLGCPGLRYVNSGKPVHQVAVGGGACASELMDAYRAGCDTFVTSDIKYNQFWDAKDLGMNLIDAGHFYTENPVTACLAEKIAAAFPDVEVKISETHRDCMKFY